MSKTNILILLCIAVSMFYWYAHAEGSIVNIYINPNKLDDLLIFRGSSFLEGNILPLITSLLIHANLQHLIGNMIFLYVFGNTIEKELGSKKVISAFLAGGILSFLISIPVYGVETRMLGASAAIFTLTAIVMLIKPLKFSWLFLMPQGLIAILYFTYNVMASIYIRDQNIGYIAHIIGFMIGFLIGIKWSKGRWKKNLAIAMLLLIGYVTIMVIL